MERETAEQRLQGFIGALQERYPDASLALEYNNAFELLIAVILSAQCRDERVNQVSRELFKKYRSAADFVSVPVEVLEQDIRPTGFYRNKAKNIRACCEILLARYGGELPRSIDEMVELPGVGRKTAAMVLGNACGLEQGIAVDTHVKRVMQRTGLSPYKTPEKIERDLMARVPQKQWTWFSNAVILHGRETCTARNPRCFGCVTEKWCRYEQKRSGR